MKTRVSDTHHVTVTCCACRNRGVHVTANRTAPVDVIRESTPAAVKPVTATAADATAEDIRAAVRRATCTLRVPATPPATATAVDATARSTTSATVIRPVQSIRDVRVRERVTRISATVTRDAISRDVGRVTGTRLDVSASRIRDSVYAMWHVWDIRRCVRATECAMAMWF